MAYILPRAVIVLIASGTTCLLMDTFTDIAPRVFYMAGGVWSVVGLVCFGYIQRLYGDENAQPVPLLVKARTPAE